MPAIRSVATGTSKRPFIVGVMGGAQADEAAMRTAYRLGELIAGRGWVLLNGGRNAGVMDASARGAAEHGGLTIGILPDATPDQASAYVRVPICTGMGSARNSINVLSSDVVVACPGGAGTLSEIALALKHGKSVITIGYDARPCFGNDDYAHRLFEAASAEEAVAIIERRFSLTEEESIRLG